jgi:hypothetical protein
VTPRRRRRTVRATVAASAAFLLPLLASCATADPPTSGAAGDTAGNTAAQPTTPPSTPPSGTVTQEEPMRIQLTIGSQQATATLEDNAAARDLVTLLPVTVAMGDLFGREKPGRLPRALAGDVAPVFTYRVGQLAYWPPTHDLFVVYDGDGLRVPNPGLIPLGTVDSGLDVIAEAGDDFDLTITALD